MNFRRLGHSDVEISRVGLGCMSFAGNYGAADPAIAADTMRAALDAGINFFDTADVYGAGLSETLVGNALRSVRERVVIATKGGATRNAEGLPDNNGSPRHLKAACDASLKRLGIDTIDLYYLHRVDPAVPIEESIGAMAELVRAGKVRYIGLSEASPETIRRAHAMHPISALQTEYSLSCRFVERDILPLCSELGITFVAYGPLGRGLLSGTLSADTVLPSNDARAVIPRFSGDNLASNLVLTEQLQDMANTLGITPSQLALAWVVGQAGPLTAIPGTRDPARVRSNAAAADIEMPSEMRDALNALFADEAVQGARHAAHMLARNNL
jgi:aryl-alcohol dehydrogenase-like predicted oxidoreductase